MLKVDEDHVVCFQRTRAVDSHAGRCAWYYVQTLEIHIWFAVIRDFATFEFSTHYRTWCGKEDYECVIIPRTSTGFVIMMYLVSS
jgi:hypothetical protein